MSIKCDRARKGLQRFSILLTTVSERDNNLQWSPLLISENMDEYCPCPSGKISVRSFVLTSSPWSFLVRSFRPCVCDFIYCLSEYMSWCAIPSSSKYSPYPFSNYMSWERFSKNSKKCENMSPIFLSMTKVRMDVLVICRRRLEERLSVESERDRSGVRLVLSFLHTVNGLSRNRAFILQLWDTEQE